MAPDPATASPDRLPARAESREMRDDGSHEWRTGFPGDYDKGMSMPQTASEPAQQPERSDSAASKRTAPDDDRPPWRAEGARSAATRGRRLPPQRPSLWVALAVLLAIDWILVLAYQPSVPQRVTVPYTYFTQQIQQGNVARSEEHTSEL